MSWIRKLFGLEPSPSKEYPGRKALETRLARREQELELLKSDHFRLCGELEKHLTPAEFTARFNGEAGPPVAMQTVPIKTFHLAQTEWQQAKVLLIWEREYWIKSRQDSERELALAKEMAEAKVAAKMVEVERK